MALILNLETATKACSVAISNNSEVLALKEFISENFSHAEKLNLFIEEVLIHSGKKLKDLDAVAISEGPGSYTGLRIGTSTAKGICFALDKPLIAINSLKSLAALKKIENGLICPMFDARRKEVYMALFDKDLNEQMPTKAEIVENDQVFISSLESGPVHFIGPGADKCVEVIKHENAFFDRSIEVSASGMVKLSQEKFENKDFVDLAYFEPYYLKDFVAGPPKKLV